MLVDFYSMHFCYGPLMPFWKCKQWRCWLVAKPLFRNTNTALFHSPLFCNSSLVDSWYRVLYYKFVLWGFGRLFLGSRLPWGRPTWSSKKIKNLKNRLNRLAGYENHKVLKLFLKTSNLNSETFCCTLFNEKCVWNSLLTEF